MVLPDFNREYHRSRTRFNSDSVIDRRLNPLLATQVAFRRLDGNMPQKELDLFQLSSCRVAEAGAGASLMPHAALAALCRIPDHAESLDLSRAGPPFGSLAMRHNPYTKTDPATLDGMRAIIDSKPS